MRREEGRSEELRLCALRHVYTTCGETRLEGGRTDAERLCTSTSEASSTGAAQSTGSRKSRRAAAGCRTLGAGRLYLSWVRAVALVCKSCTVEYVNDIRLREEE